MVELPKRISEFHLTSRQLQLLGAALAFVVASIHLFHPQRGFPRLVLLAATDNLGLLAGDPRPLLFVLSGFAIIIGVLLVLWDFPEKPIYIAGIVLTLTYIVGYFAWHLSGHGGFLPGREPLYHGLTPIEAVVSHLQDYPIARWSKLTEFLLLVVLVLLYRRKL
jgi:hypothetical protein